MIGGGLQMFLESGFYSDTISDLLGIMRAAII